jgi:hypothetical protein
MESSQWRNQKLVEKRIETWDRIGPHISDIYCYCLRVGNWKQHRPSDIVACKRELDKLAHLSRPYFSTEFFSSYQRFMESCFQMFQDHGTDARIRTEMWEHEIVHDEWTPEWAAMMSEEPFDEHAVAGAYTNLLAAVRREINQETPGSA